MIHRLERSYLFSKGVLKTAATVQATYPIKEGGTFDDEHSVSTHVPLVREHVDPAGMTSATVSKDHVGGPDVPLACFAVATMPFPDEAGMGVALNATGPELGGIPNFATVQPDLLIGAVIA
jgi:hypothetical protein